MSYPRLAERLYNVPLLMTLEKAEIIEAVFRAHVEGRSVVLPKVEQPQIQELMAGSVSLRQTDAGYYVSSSGVAVVPVHGSLVQRGGGLMESMSGMTGYNRLGNQMAAAERDPQVRGIVMEVDSPGGEVAGAFELATLVSTLGKPVWAHANEFAASAAYLLGASASRLYAPQTGQVGSVGVIMLHMDRSKAAEKAGISYTPIFAGARKLDGSSMSPLSEEARASAQARVDSLYDLFIAHVAEGRGVAPEVVRNTEAAVMSIQDATELGMADGVATLGDVIQMFTDDLNASRTPYKPKRYRAEVGPLFPGDRTMTKETNPAATTTAAAQAPTPEATAAANPAPQANAAAAPATDLQATERARISGILTHAEASSRRALAEHFAFQTTMSVEEVVAALKVAPKDVSAAAVNPLAAAMAHVPNPVVGADGTAAAAAAVGGARKTINLAAIYENRKLKSIK